MSFGWSGIGGSLPAITEQMSESPTVSPDSQPTDPVITPGGLAPEDNISTLGRLSQGSCSVKYVVAIEGCQYLLSDAPQASVRSAWTDASGGDWASATVLGGLFVELSNSQSISPDDPFPQGGQCRVKLLDTTGSDTFGVFVHKRNTGDKTTLTATADRNDTTLTVARAADFASSGDVHVGVECVGHTGTGATSFTGCTRGKYSPFGCDSSGSGGNRFARHHRVSTDLNTTLSNPVVSEVPRSWIGRHCGIWLHTWNEETQALNTRAQAQLVYAGRVVGIGDDPDTFCTVLDIEHISAEFKNGIIFRDPLIADVAEGMQLVEGRVFTFSDFVLVSTASVASTATDLTVVASGASGAYQVDAGYYTGRQICEVLSRWLAQAKADADINGYYNWQFAVSSNLGPRTKLYWRIENANTYQVSWRMELPGEVAAFLGLLSDEDSPLGQQAPIKAQGWTSEEDKIFQGELAPYSSLIFKPLGPGRLGQEFATYAVKYEIENERGAFVDQYDLLPASIKEASPSGNNFGLFLLDDRVLMVAAYDSAAHTITNCWLAPFQLTADTSTDALPYIGRRIDEPPAPVSIRQIIVAEGKVKSIVSQFVYSSGVAGLNHATYDTLPATLSLGMPGSLFGPEWDRSLANLPGADGVIAIVIDEPTKFSELFRDDFRIRRAFIRWADQGFEFATWRTPVVALASHDLTEANKAAPAGQDENHRIASQETDEWNYSTVKIDYCRDFATGRNGQYLKSIQLEDQSGADAGGSVGRSLTLKMRNTSGQFSATGASIEELIPGYLVGMPMFSRPSRKIVRSIDLRKFEAIHVGDIVTLDDNFSRDPITGVRGGATRAWIVARKTYDLGGPTPTGQVRPMFGEVELFSLDTQRSGIYSPGAEVDSEINFGGFAGGYNSTTKTLRLKKNAYSFITTIDTKRGPVSYVRERDASWFEAGYKIVVCERDPSDPASPTSWTDTVVSVSGDDLVLTTGLTSWDAAKKYRVFFQPYTSCTVEQQDYVFQADEADEMIQDTEIADQFAATNVDTTFVATSTADKAELVATLTYGDGKPLDTGTDYALGATANALYDYKTAHQAPFLWDSAMQPVDEASTEWATFFFGPIFVGMNHTSSTITQSLNAAPFFWSNAGAGATVRVAIMSSLPVQQPSIQRYLPGEQFRQPFFVDRFAVSAEWTTTSTTAATGETRSLSLGTKDLARGYVWLIVQGKGDVRCRGLSKLYEGPRVAA